jgi:hypothetical protein
MEFLSPNVKAVSVLLTPSSNNTMASYTFPTQQDLENRKIVAIEAFCGGVDVLYDPLNSGVQVMGIDLFQSAFLTLYTAAVTNPLMNGGQQQAGLFYDKIPLPRLRMVQNSYAQALPAPSNSGGPFIIRPTEISFTKSKVEFPTNVPLTTQKTATFLFHYLDLGDNGDWWLKAMGFGNR